MHGHAAPKKRDKYSRSDRRSKDSGTYLLEGIHPHSSTVPTQFCGSQSSILTLGGCIAFHFGMLSDRKISSYFWVAG